MFILQIYIMGLHAGPITAATLLRICYPYAPPR